MVKEVEPAEKHNSNNSPDEACNYSWLLNESETFSSKVYIEFCFNYQLFNEKIDSFHTNIKKLHIEWQFSS